MNEVEKMYKNAGLSNMWVERYNDGYYEHERYYNSYKEMINNMMKVNDWTLSEAQEVAKRECRKEHSPFTAEKQLELIKWLARKDYGNYAESLLISIRDGYNYLSVGITTEFGSECFYEDFTFDNKQFDEAIAGIINKLWKKLTEEERKQIKEILE